MRKHNPLCRIPLWKYPVKMQLMQLRVQARAHVRTHTHTHISRLACYSPLGCCIYMRFIVYLINHQFQYTHNFTTLRNHEKINIQYNSPFISRFSFCQSSILHTNLCSLKLHQFCVQISCPI